MNLFTEEEILKSKIAMKGYNFFCDMDQVLTEFEGYFKSKTGKYCEPFIKKYGENAFWKVIQSDPNWFINLPVRHDAHQLWEFIKPFNPTILTTPGGNIERCKKQKRQWINKYFGKNISIIFSDKKYEYASPNAILIDDMKHNVEPWIDYGGIGILHISTKDTLNQLREILI